MRRLIVIVGLGAGVLMLALWLSGGFALIEAEVRAAQRAFQTALAPPLRELKAGKGGAFAALLALAFGYGLAHAVGPGHGKVLIGGYALGSRAGLAKLVGLSLAASLAQATFAVLLVYAGIWAIGWGRDQLRGVAENWLAPLSALTIAVLGLWLAGRGLRHLRQAAASANRDMSTADHHAPHDHHDHPCAHCNHAHGPSADDVAAVHDWRAAAALIGGIAIRPCTGALFLLILTWQMGIAVAGIAGAYAMGLGTAVITIAAALGALALREGLLVSLARSRVLSLALPVLEIAAGLLIALIATTLAFGPL